LGAPTFSEAVRALAETFHVLRGILKDAGHVTSVGDEGGYAPNVKHPDEALQLMMQAIEKAGHQPGQDMSLALDVAASELYTGGEYQFAKAGLKSLGTSGMIGLLAELTDRFPIVSIEDGLAEDDWDGWRTLTERLGSRIMLVGDDLFCTNPAIIRKGIA